MWITCNREEHSESSRGKEEQKNNNTELRKNQLQIILIAPWAGLLFLVGKKVVLCPVARRGDTNRSKIVGLPMKGVVIMGWVTYMGPKLLGNDFV